MYISPQPPQPPQLPQPQELPHGEHAPQPQPQPNNFCLRQHRNALRQWQPVAVESTLIIMMAMAARRNIGRSPQELCAHLAWC